MSKAKIIMSDKEDKPIRFRDINDDEWFIDTGGALSVKYSSQIKISFRDDGVLYYLNCINIDQVVTPVNVEIKVTKP